jgi:GGDEF domain-containing protein
VREHVREPDRVTRASADRFQVLLPETDEASAGLLGDRIREACTTQLSVAHGGVEIIVAAASPGHGETLQDALGSAQEAVAA